MTAAPHPCSRLQKGGLAASPAALLPTASLALFPDHGQTGGYVFTFSGGTQTTLSKSPHLGSDRVWVESLPTSAFVGTNQEALFPDCS